MHGGQLVAQLIESGPDVVEELNLDHRLETPRGHPDRPADDVGLRERRVVDAVAPEAFLQAPGHHEDAALSLHLAGRLLPGDIGDVLAEDHDARIALHL